MDVHIHEWSAQLYPEWRTQILHGSRRSVPDRYTKPNNRVMDLPSKPEIEPCMYSIPQEPCTAPDATQDWTNVVYGTCLAPNKRIECLDSPMNFLLIHGDRCQQVAVFTHNMYRFTAFLSISCGWSEYLCDFYPFLRFSLVSFSDFSLLSFLWFFWKHS